MSKRSKNIINIAALLSFLVINFVFQNAALSHSNNNNINNSSGFHASIQPIPASIKPQVLRYTWRPGCPVGISQLAYLKMSFWGFDHRRHQGELIVNRNVAREVVDIFNQLYVARFPIARMQPMHVFKGNDLAAMEANSTVAFMCRPKTGHAHGFSRHSYGLAIDINPIQNPYLKGNIILPPSGQINLNRNQQTSGMIHPGDIVYSAFTKRGWHWGGSWTIPKDYMHFEK